MSGKRLLASRAGRLEGLKELVSWPVLLVAVAVATQGLVVHLGSQLVQVNLYGRLYAGQKCRLREINKFNVGHLNVQGVH